MKIVKTALVSAISLGIAMSAAALSAGPSLAQEAVQKPHLPVLGKGTCLTSTLTLPTAGTAVDTGLGITFTLGAAKPVQLLFSSDITTAAGGTAVDLSYSIDGGTPSPIGPTHLVPATGTGVTETHTAYAITPSLRSGRHIIAPFLTSTTTGTTAGSRCFAVLNTNL